MKEPVVLVSGDTHLTLVFAAEPGAAEALKPREMPKIPEVAGT